MPEPPLGEPFDKSDRPLKGSLRTRSDEDIRGVSAIPGISYLSVLTENFVRGVVEIRTKSNVLIERDNIGSQSRDSWRCGRM
jgi:hypothetical protein